MKILFSDNSLWSLLNFRSGVIRHLAARGCEIVLVAPAPDRTLPLPEGVRHIPVRIDRAGTNPLKDWRYYRRLVKIYRAEAPDYIFHYTIKPNIYGTLAARSAGVPSSAMVAGLGYAFGRRSATGLAAKMLYRYALGYAENVFVLNRTNLRTLVGHRIVSEGKILLLEGGEGIDLEAFGPLPYPANGRPRLLMIARLLYEKGYSEFVEAARMLHGSADFCIMGALDTNPAAVPAERVERDVRSGAIRWIPFSRDVRAQVARADAIVLPSYHEGLSRVLMEALALGRPIICSDIPGCRETVREGENGFLCEVRSAESLTEACRKFIALGADARIRMGRAGRLLAERIFDERRVIECYDRLLCSRFAGKGF